MAGVATTLARKFALLRLAVRSSIKQGKKMARAKDFDLLER